MSEHLVPERPIQEILRPSVTPEMGFQSYELLDGDAKYRNAQQKAFLSGEIINPTFDYPHLNEVRLKKGISTLNNILDLSRTMDDPSAADAVWDSASYRMAEMYWLLEAKRLNEYALSDPDSEEFRESAHRYQDVNEQLYGKPGDELTANVYGEILAQAQAKNLPLKARQILNEFSEGTNVEVAGKTIEVPGAHGKESGRLPEGILEKLTVLREVLREEFADVIELIENYYEAVISPRALELGTAEEFTIHDMKTIFELVHKMRDPENLSGITVVFKSDAAQLSWDTPTMAIQIGKNRKPITSVAEMVAKVVHEYGVHGTRAVNGLRTELPVLGTGIYSEANEGERADYLTFEEGVATLCEMALNPTFGGWGEDHVSRYLAVASAYEGADFRQAFEVNWRARALMVLKDGQELTDEVLAKQQKQAYISVRRIYRATPTHVSDDRPLMTFNKDLAYLEGKIVGLKFLEQAGDDKAAIRRIFAGKFDPTNHRQNELVKKYVDDIPHVE